MAHGDYLCCAICDRKMAYSSMALSKESLCPDCAINFFEATGEKITRGDSLVEWMQRNRTTAKSVLDSIGFSICFYGNDVDETYGELE